MSPRSFVRIALVSAVVVAAGIWAYNRFPALQRALGGSVSLKKAA